MTVDQLAAVAPFPLAPLQSRWRTLLMPRQFGPWTTTQWMQAVTSELTSARSRRLDQNWNQPAQYSFTVDGRDPAAAAIAELTTDVMVTRYDEWTGLYQQVFRGVVGQSEDEITEQTHTVNFTCHDYLAMLARRYLTAAAPLTFTQTDQDTIAANLITYASAVTTGGTGASFAPGSYLPLQAFRANPDGTARAAAGPLRDRSYTGQSNIGELLDDLAHVIGGFDYDTIPAYANPGSGFGGDPVRIFYPQQGVNRTDITLVYGSTVAGITRTVDSSNYANYVRVLGDTPTGSPDGTPPMFSEAWNTDANNVPVNGLGLWMNADNAADVNIQSTLDQQAQGDLALSGLLVPSYTITLAPGAYRYGYPNMGDTVGLVVQSGRLNVTSLPPDNGVRVVGMSFVIGDDGQEDVELTVGRPLPQLFTMLTQADRDANALTRR